MTASPLPCIACGSLRTTPTEEFETLTVPYGPSCQVALRTDKCLDCESWGDFSGVNEDKIRLAFEELTQASVVQILEFFEQNGLVLTHIERVLQLPFGSLTRLKQGAPLTPETVALLRILRTYPWIVPASDYWGKSCNRCGTAGPLRPCETRPEGVDRPAVIEWVCLDTCKVT